MYRSLTALVLIASATAATAQETDFFVGRPPSVGVVRGGGFGSSGTDYYGESRPDVAPPRLRHARAAVPAAGHRASGNRLHAGPKRVAQP